MYLFICTQGNPHSLWHTNAIYCFLQIYLWFCPTWRYNEVGFFYSQMKPFPPSFWSHTLNFHLYLVLLDEKLLLHNLNSTCNSWQEQNSVSKDAFPEVCSKQLTWTCFHLWKLRKILVHWKSLVRRFIKLKSGQVKNIRVEGHLPSHTITFAKCCARIQDLKAASEMLSHQVWEFVSSYSPIITFLTILQGILSPNT